MRRIGFIIGLVIAMSGAPAPGAQTVPWVQRAAAQQNADWALQQAANQRAMAQRSELEAQTSQLQTEARIGQMREQAQSYRVPDPAYPEHWAMAPADLPNLPQIPDADLAASRQRILEASRNRR